MLANCALPSIQPHVVKVLLTCEIWVLDRQCGERGVCVLLGDQLARIASAFAVRAASHGAAQDDARVSGIF